MERLSSVQELLGQTDIYLIDQILKGTYKSSDCILDAGCGGGRNMHWFLLNEISIFGIDQRAEIICEMKKRFPLLPDDRFAVASVEELPFNDNSFDHVISSAVLHFAKDEIHFNRMFGEMYRVLKTGGTFFIRTATDIGIEDRVELLDVGVYRIPDGSNRFLITRKILAQLQSQYGFTYFEPMKTVNVNDIRSMITLILRKN